MPNAKISELAAAGALAGTELVPIVQSGATKRTTLAAVVALGVPSSRTVSAGTGLTGGGNLSADRTLAADFGNAAGKVCEGNDARLSDARTPSAHASAHAPGGSDPVAGGWTDVLTTTNGNDTLDGTDFGKLQRLTCSDGDYTLTLPASAAGQKGKRIGFVLHTNGAHTATVATAGGDTYLGPGADLTLTGVFASQKVKSLVLVDDGAGSWLPESGAAGTISF